MHAARIIATGLALIVGIILIRFGIDGSSSLSAVLISLATLTAFLGLSSLRKNQNNEGNSPSQRTSFIKGETRLAASMLEAIIIVDDRKRMVHINPAAHNLFPDIKVGESIMSVSSNDKLAELVGGALNGNRSEPFVYQIYDPVERHIRVTGSILQPEPGLVEQSRAVVIFYDVTDLERANALRADFLANASHELKTPLASLLGYIETLTGHARDDEEARHMFLGIMQQQAERMQRLINDILSLRSIELSEHRAPTATADFYLAYLAAKESVAPMAEQSEIKIKYSGPKELLVLGAQDELVQLVLNIIDNAVKMSEPGENLDIRGDVVRNWQPEFAFATPPIAPNSARRQIVTPAEAGQDYAQICIRDKGPGFKEENLPRLSERFYRIAGDRSSEKKGTGLGLAIVKHIILRHRGGLFVETAEGVGTEFTILIPISDNPETPEPKPDQATFAAMFTKQS